MNRTIVWFRRDLRISDHAPLYRAALRGEVIPVFVFDRALLHHPETAPARVEFMLSCLSHLDQELRRRGGRLILRCGDPADVLPALICETEAEGIYAHIDFERIYGRVRDARLNRVLTSQDMKIRWFEPAGTTPDLLAYPDYRDRWFRDMEAQPTPIPPRIVVPDFVASEPIPNLKDLGWEPDGKPIPAGGTKAARQILQEFLSQKTERYYWQLSYPAAEVTSGLSPYIKFGVISTRQCYQTTKAWQPQNSRMARSQSQFISRLRWGSGFAQRFRYLPQLELRSLYSVFEEGWEFNEGLYEAWQQGQTGFPIIDAAARCLMETGGWMQMNFRTRAIYASFLGNLVGMDWRYGALHFMRHLIDGDCPIDHYQWAMQSGVTHCVDKTWTRIYNPEQAAVDRCDPDGTFIKQWVPEVAHLPPHQLGCPPRLRDYPPPILDYRIARQKRVKQLERQRQTLIRAQNIAPHVARLPQNLTPFGSDRHPCFVAWAAESNPDLFPPPLDLEALDSHQASQLRTWFVAHVEIQPRRVSSSSQRSPSRASGQSEITDDTIQLSLLSS